MKKLFLIVLLLGFCAYANAAPIDLSTWSAVDVGWDSSSNWTPAADGSSVLQTRNGAPTAFVSPESFIGKQFRGSFGVETSSDDDYIGFVFGYNSPTDFLLFDWKQNNQDTSLEGFTLSKFTGPLPANNNVSFWDNDDDVSYSNKTILASDHDTTKGWADNTVYDFVLDYTANRIVIQVGLKDSPTLETIFDVSGIFSAGQFGFYNYSQSQVRYSGFTEDTSPIDPPGAVPEPNTMLLLSFGLLSLAGINRKKE